MRVSNKLRAFLIVVVSIVAVAVALPILSTMVKADTCTIFYHANNGTEDMTSEDVEQGTPFNLSPNAFSKADCTFAYWTEDKDGSGTHYKDKAEYNPIDAEVNLFAQWVPNITITFAANDGTSTSDATQTVGQGLTTKLDSNPFSRSGYDFIGWNTDKDATDVLYKDNDSITLNENTTLYAIWAKKITITFHSNNGSDTTTIQNAHANETIKLDKNSFNSPSTDKTFSRWTLGGAGEFDNAYVDEATITLDDNIPNIDTIDNIDLYANWADICTITFDPGAGTGTPYTQEIPQGFNTALVKYTDQFSAPANKEFAGWIFDETYTATDGQDVYFVTSAKTFTAQWKWVQYTVTTSAGENGTITGTQSYDYGTTDVVLEASPATGYHVAKWVVDGDDIVTNDKTYTIPIINAPHTVSVEFAIDTFTVTAAIDSSSPSGAGVSPESDVVNYGSNVTLTATTPTGYHVAKWIDNGVETENTDISNKKYTINSVTGDHNVTVVFAKNVYDVGVNSDPALGCKDITIIGTREYGTKVEVKVTPETGYHVSKIEVNGGSTYTFDVVDTSDSKTVTVSDSIESNYTVNVVFEKNIYTVTTNSDTVENGTISATSTYEHGTNVVLTASPSAGYHVSKVTIGGDSTDYTTVDKTEDVEIKIDAIASNKTVSVEFAINTYSVDIDPETVTCGTISGNGSYNHGAGVSLTISPETGYHVANVILDGTTVWSNETVNATEEKTVPIIAAIDGNHSVKVEYAINTYVINASVSDSNLGSISYSGDGTHGTKVVFTASPETGYHVAKWIVNGEEFSGESLEKPLEYTIGGIISDLNVQVVFDINSYTINVESAGNGSVTGEGTYNHFETYTIVATPYTGYHFVNWTDKVTGNPVSDNATYTDTATGSRDFVANFAINSYTIKVTTEGHGTVEGGYTSIDHFKEATVKATPDEGYHFLGWVENGTIVSKDATYTFTATSNRTLEAVFEVNMYTVTYKDDDGTILQQSEFAWGTNAYFQKATPTKDPTAQFTYKFAGWDNKVTRVTGDVTYTAVYDKTINQYTVTFVNADGKVLQTGLVDYGAMPTYDGETPVKAATVEYTYTFAGWDKEITKVQGDITYTATYSEKKFEKGDIDYVYFKVMFNSNGGSDVVTQLVQDGYTATIPDDPMRERYNFAGWYLDEDLTKPFSFSTPITSDITLYAKWVKGVQEVTVTYAVVGDGTVKWEAGSSEGVVITVDRSQDNDTGAEHFKSIQIDGEEVAYFNYEVSEGSATITLSTDILKDMAPGTYKVTILFDDGQAEVDLVIEGGETPTEEVTETPTEAGDPATGDDGGNTTGPNYIGLWIALGVVALVCIAAAPILIIKRRGVK